MFLEPLYSINNQDMPGLEIVTLTPNHQPMQATRYDQAHEYAIPKNSVGMLVYRNNSATAWISDVLPTPFKFRIGNLPEHNAIAIAVTTAHTTLIEGAYPAVWDFFTKSVPDIQNDDSYLAIPLIDFVDHHSDFKDPINLNSYSIPDDIMLFLILECPNPVTRLSYMPIYQNPVAKNTPVSIFGYPVYSKLERVYPLVSRFPVLEQTVIDAICGGSKLVRSDGVIEEAGEMHAVSCTTANGMSGSPVVILENGIAKVAGMLCGGPAAPLQRTLIELLYAAKSYDGRAVQSILNYFANLPYLNSLITQKNFEKMTRAVLSGTQHCYSNIMTSYIGLIANYVLRVDPRYVNHNLVLPVTSPGFMIALHCSSQITTDAELYSRVVTYEFLSERLKFYKTLIP